MLCLCFGVGEILAAIVAAAFALVAWLRRRKAPAATEPDCLTPGCCKDNTP